MELSDRRGGLVRASLTTTLGAHNKVALTAEGERKDFSAAVRKLLSWATSRKVCNSFRLTRARVLVNGFIFVPEAGRRLFVLPNRIISLINAIVETM